MITIEKQADLVENCPKTTYLSFETSDAEIANKESWQQRVLDFVSAFS